MSHWIKRLALLAVLAGVVGAFVYAFRPQPIEVDLADAVRGPMRVTIDEEGETRIRNRFIVSAPVAGRVLRIDLEPGDPVRRQQTVIATFLPAGPSLLDARSRTEAEARLRGAQAELGRARANRDRIREELSLAESQLERYEEMLEAGIVSRERVDVLDTDARSLRESLNTAEFEISDAEEAVEAARAALIQTDSDDAADPITIRSPIDGVVLRRLRESEAVVPAGEPLVEVGNVDDIEIVSDLLSEDAVRVSPGDRVLIEQWGGGVTLEGSVRRVEPSGFTKLSALGVEEQRVNVIIDFRDPGQAAEDLGDGYRVEIRIVIWETEDTLKVPTGSLFRNGDGWAVFVAVDETAELRVVEIGRRNGTEAEVLSGLTVSDRVILYPSDEVTDGSQIVDRAA